MYLKESSFRFRNTITNETVPYTSKTLKVQLDGKTVLLPVWNGYNSRISIPKLNKFNWVLEYCPPQSMEYITYYKCAYMFQRFPDLVNKVTNLKQVYDKAGIKYNATSAQMEDAILKLDNPTIWPQLFSEAAESLAILLDKAYEDYMINIEKDYDHNPVGTWSVYKELPTLIQWLPNTYDISQIPKLQRAIVVESEEQFQLIIKSSDTQ